MEPPVTQGRLGSARGELRHPGAVSRSLGTPPKEQRGGLSPTAGALPGPYSSRAPFPTLSGSLCPALGQPLAAPGQQGPGSSILGGDRSILRGVQQHPLGTRTPSLADICLGADHAGGPARGCAHPPSHGCQAEPRSGSDRVSAAC